MEKSSIDKFHDCVLKVSKEQSFSSDREAFLQSLITECHSMELSQKYVIQEIQELDFIKEIPDFDVGQLNEYYHEPEIIPDSQIEDQETMMTKVENFLSLHYQFKYNIVRDIVEYRNICDDTFMELTELGENTILRRIEKARLKCSQQTLRIILCSDYAKVYNPIEDYFNELPEWDGIDHISALAAQVKTKDDKLWKEYLQRWLTAMVASAIDDKIVNHQVLIFSGSQGIGKTSWVNNLIPKELKEYYYSGTINLKNKDTLVNLSECIIINLDELARSRKDDDALKEIITKGQILIRRSYGKRNQRLPRRASFTASVNDQQFLYDSTGSRRYLVIEAASFDLSSKIDLKQLYAHAFHLYKSGYKHWFDETEGRQITIRNEAYLSKTIEEELILTYFDIPKNSSEVTHKLNATMLLKYFKDLGVAQISNSNLNRVGKALKKLKFSRVKSGGTYVYLLKEKSS